LHLVHVNLSKSLVTDAAFREIFQSMSEGIVMVDVHGVIVTANPVAEDIFGYEKDGLTGLALEQLLPERYRGRHIDFRKGFNAHPEPRRMGFGRDLTAIRRNGREFSHGVLLLEAERLFSVLSDLSHSTAAPVQCSPSPERRSMLGLWLSARPI